MRRSFTVILIAAFVCSVSGAYASSGITLKSSKGYTSQLEVNVSEVKLFKTEVLGKDATVVYTPEGILSFDKDAPQLPRMTAMVMVDPAKNPTFKVSQLQAEVIDLEAPVVPSKGNFTRDIDPDSVAYNFGPVYTQDKWYPSDEELVVMSDPFIFREIRGVNLVVSPVQYNPVQKKLRIHRQLNVTVNIDSEAGKNPVKASKPISRVFEPIYRDVFVNFDQASKRLPRTGTTYSFDEEEPAEGEEPKTEEEELFTAKPIAEDGRLLIICYDDFMKALTPFVSWKKKIGTDVKIVKSSEAGATADAIKTFIQKEYDKGGLTHIMLIGDSEQIPTLKGVKERADSDPCYTKLAGDDHVPDAIISRLSATTLDEVAYQVAKFVNYEQFPTANDQGWYSTGTGIASGEGNPKDYERAEWLRESLEKAMFTKIDQIYDKSYSESATAAQVTEVVNAGRSLINYIGHGSTTSWATTGFSNTNCGNLANGWKMPIIWSVACVNGNFVGKTCFGEAWMRAGNLDNPKGAVAIYASTTNQEWVPPCIVQAEINQNYIVNKVFKTVGGLALNGIMKGCEKYGTSSSGSGIMMAEQWHIFGDGSLVARFGKQKSVSAKVVAKRADDTVSVNILVTDEEGNPVRDAKVSVYSARIRNRRVARTNDEGEAAVTLPGRVAGAFVTVFGPELIPVVDQKIEF